MLVIPAALLLSQGSKTFVFDTLEQRRLPLQRRQIPVSIPRHGLR
jgi:hypothetical protein